MQKVLFHFQKKRSKRWLGRASPSGLYASVKAVWRTLQGFSWTLTAAGLKKQEPLAGLSRPEKSLQLGAVNT
ncbi:MAG: hypothetical protein WBQ90_12150, partial [Pedobacter sp.]